MKESNSHLGINLFIYTLVSLPVLAIGIVVGIRWKINDTLIFIEGAPTVCKVTELGMNPPATRLGYYAEFEFINDNYVKRARQTISQARYHSINVGDCYLGFHRPNGLNQIHVLFDIPVIDTSETTLTILYK